MRNFSVAIVASQVSPTIQESLIPVAHKRGVRCEVVNPSGLEVSSIESDDFVRRLCEFDVAYYRTGLEAAGASAVYKILQQRGIPFVNANYAQYPFVREKLYQIISCAQAGIQVATTLLRERSYAVAVEKLGSPFVAKASVSSKGKDVVLITTEEEFTATMERDDKTWILQEFVPHDGDYRVRIVNGRAVSVHGHKKGDDFRSNNANGGTTVLVPEGTLKQELRLFGEQVAKVFPLDIAAIDILPHGENGKLYFTEINANPGWDREEIPVVGIDMDELVLDYFGSLVG